MTKPSKKAAWADVRRTAARSLARITDEEDAEITRAAAADPDNPIIDERMFVRMRPAAEVAPEIVRRARGQRGPKKSKPSGGLVR